MFRQILPHIIDNQYKGKKIALYFFYLLTAITIIRSCIHIFKYDGGAQSIATIPLDTFTDNGASAVILIFAYWGLSQLIVGIMYIIVALYYKSMIPLMYLFIFMEYTGRLIIATIKPIETTSQAPGSIANYVLIPLSLILFVLSVDYKLKIK